MEPGQYSTNILSVNNLSSIHYEYFVPQSTVSSTVKKELLRLESKWRQEGYMVYYDLSHDRIWEFRGQQNSPKLGLTTLPESLIASEINSLGFLHAETGIYEPFNLIKNRNTLSISINDSSEPARGSHAKMSFLGNDGTLHNKTTASSPADLQSGGKKGPSTLLNQLHEYFISAVLASITYFLCCNNKYILFNSRTLIPTTSKSSLHFGPLCAVEFATLDVDLTSMGTLLVKVYFDVVYRFRNLTSLLKKDTFIDELKLGTPLWLGPGGNPAKFYSVLDDNVNTSGSLENDLKTSFNTYSKDSFKSWKKEILEWLSCKGLDPALLNKNGWLLVQILDSKSLFPSLENYKTVLPDHLTIVPWPALLCFQYFPQYSSKLNESCPKNSSPRDPLIFAEEWFTSHEQRALIKNQRQEERNIAEAVSKEKADTEARTTCSQFHSPINLRRWSMSGNIYPTPPDIMQSLVGATPSFDSSISTPGNLNNFPVSDTALIASGNTTSNRNSLEGWVSSEKREQDSSEFNINETYAENDHDMNDLDETIFGENITDDDFKFFDQPGAQPMELDTVSPADFYSENSGVEPNDDTIMDLSLSSRQKNHEYDDIVMNKQCSNRNLTSAEHIKSQIQITSFNKETVFNEINFQESSPELLGKTGQNSLYDEVNFSKSLHFVNEKYCTSGLFEFSIGAMKSQASDMSSLPKTNYLKERQRTSDKLTESKQKLLILLRKEAQQTSCEESQESSADSDSCSQNSENEMNRTDRSCLHKTCNIGIENPFESDRNDENDLILEPSIRESKQTGDSEPTINIWHEPISFLDASAWPLNFYLSSEKFDDFPNISNDREYVAAAQIIADQALSGIFQFIVPSRNYNLQEKNETKSTRKMMSNLTKAVKHFFHDANACNFREFLNIQGVHISNQVLRLPPRPNTNLRIAAGTNDRSNNLFAIPTPRIEVRRADSSLWVFPAAVTYWENIGLAPFAGPKNIESVCVYPDFEGMARNSGVFLDRVRSIYESYKFGSHNRIQSKEINDGLVPFRIDDLQRKNSDLLSLRDILGNLGRALSCLSSQEKNLVVYFVYPLDNNKLLFHICSAFQHLLNMYRKALQEKRVFHKHEIKLQLVPFSFINSSSSLAIPSPSEYFGLVLGLYDRCISFTSSSSIPAIILEKALPKSIDFKLYPYPSDSLLQENSCLHVAYSQTIDSRWITTAWTDNLGIDQMTTCYCLARKNEAVSTAFPEVANEIWETTMDFISDFKVHRRIIIAKVGVMSTSEIETWTKLASKEKTAQVNLILVTTKPDSPLRLIPHPILLFSTGAKNQNTTNQSPIVIQGPRSSFTSPDTVSNVVDIQNEPDISARLIDITDQTWGAILSHRLNNSISLVEINLALISGFLIKRGGSNIEDPPLVLEVNIVYGEIIGNPRTFHENLLKEILIYYRGLGTLARVRGMVDPILDIRPWHIAAVQKAAEALCAFT